MNKLKVIIQKIFKPQDKKTKFWKSYQKLVKKYGYDIHSHIVFIDEKTGKLISKQKGDKILEKIQPILKRWGVKLTIAFTIDENRRSS